MSRPQLARFPRRPPRAIPPPRQPRCFACEGPTWVTAFQRGERIFQAELYVGPAATKSDRAELIAVLDSLRVER